MGRSHTKYKYSCNEKIEQIDAVPNRMATLWYLCGNSVVSPSVGQRNYNHSPPTRRPCLGGMTRRQGRVIPLLGQALSLLQEEDAGGVVAGFNVPEGFALRGKAVEVAE